MKKASTVVQILYFTEDNDLVVDCPQLMVFGVVEGILAKKRLSEKMVVECFQEKLNKRIQRFDNQAAFMETMFLHGYWDVKSNSLAPKPMKYFKDTCSFVKRKLVMPNIKTATYEFEYTLEISESILEISQNIDSILGLK